MKHLFVPDLYIPSYKKLNIDFLQQKGIRLLACDIDNTLVAHDEALPSLEVKKFIHSIQEKGIEVVLISNNVRQRVELFAKDLHIKTYPFAKKPLKKTYCRILKDHNYDKHEIAVLGDQLLTDILGAKRMHFFTILTTPVVETDLTWTKLNRVIENIIYKWLHFRGYLRKGEYNG